MHIRGDGRSASLRAIACATAAFFGADAAQAQESTSQEIVVTGRLEESLPQELGRYGSRLSIIDDEAIERGNFADIGQTLQMLAPGLYVQPQSGPFSYSAASFQGSRPGEILYLIDGVRISNRLYNTTPPLDTVPAHMVERIELLEGGQGLFYGTQAVAGVINIVTRDFTDDTEGRINAGVNTNEGFTASGRLSGSMGGHHFVVYASHDQADGFRPFPKDEIQPSATDRQRGYRMTTGGLKYAYNFAPGVRFSASYQHNQGFVDFARAVDIDRAVNDRNEEIAWAKVDWDVSDNAEFFVKGYWHDWDSHYDEVDNVPGGGTDHVDDHEFWGFWDYGINALAKFTPTPGVETFLGYDFQKYWGKDDVLIIADQTEKTHAVFGQVRLTPELLPRTHLAAGVRYNAPSEGQDATVWNISGQYDLTDQFFARAAVGTSFRLPDAESLFANDPIFNGEVGNPNLKPERSKNFNGSVGAQGGGWRVELIGFWRETKDLIDLSGETPDPDVFTFINLPDKVKVRGFELAGNWAATPDLSVQGSYTHSRTRQTGSDQQLAGIPKDIAHGLIDWHPVELPFGASLAGDWVGSVVDNVSSGFGRQQHGHYVVFDLNGYFAFGKDKAHRISVRVENLLDKDYTTRVNRTFEDVTGDPYLIHYRGVPRTFHVAYSLNY